MTDKLDEKLATKIKALLAKAEKTDNPHEAAAFTAKVHELLAKHRLTIGDLKDADDPMDRTTVRLKYGEVWREQVAIAAAQYFGCVTVFSDSTKINRNGRLVRDPIVYVIGRQGARTTASLTIPYLLTSVLRAARAMNESYKTPKFRKDLRAVGFALADRLIKLTEEGKKKEAQGGVGGNWLVPINEAEAAKNKMFDNLRETTPAAPTIFARHVNAANGISLVDQVNGRETDLVRIGE